MEQFGAADAVEDRLAGLADPAFEHRRRQCLACRHRQSQRGEIRAAVHCRHHRPIGGRRGEAYRGLVGLDDLDHLRRRGIFQERRRGAEPQRKDRKPPEPKGKGQRRRADKDIVRRDLEHFPRIAVGYDHEIAMEVHGRLRLARGARGKSEQRDVIPAGPDGVEADRLVQGDAVELGIVVRGAVEVDDLLEKPAGLGACHQLVGDAAIGQRQRDLRLVDDLGQFAGAEHRHGVDDDGARFGGAEPRRDQRRIVS